MKRLLLLCISLLVGQISLWACGPFLFDNSDLDSLSLIDPGITGRPDLAPFFLYASPAFGQPSTFQQKVIRLDRVTWPSANGVTNEVYDDAPGADPDWLAANLLAWAGYLRLGSPAKPWTKAQIQAALDGKGVPAEVSATDAAYFAFLPSARATEALKRAREADLPAFLRERYAYIALRARALVQDSSGTLQLWREFAPLWARHDVIAGRALAWVASVAKNRLADYLTVFQDYPALRATVFVSLGGVQTREWSAYLAQKLSPAQRRWALYARFVLEDRDFAPETLQGLLAADPRGRLALAAFYRMVEEVEREAGVSRLMALTFDPADPLPAEASVEDRQLVKTLRRKGLYTALVDTAVKAAATSRTFRRAWLTLAAYLAFYDGDDSRMVTLYHDSLRYPARNADQRHQSHLLGTMTAMLAQRHRPWGLALQRRLVKDLAWARSLDQPGHNRGLYHSLVVLVAQKDLFDDQRDAAARAFSTLQSQTWDNPYRVRHQDWFWAASWGANDPVNLLFDVLLRSRDIAAWRKFLTMAPDQRSPLDEALTAPGWITVDDLDYLEAYKALRQGKPNVALPLAEKLTRDGYFQGTSRWRNNRSIFPARTFATSTEVAWAHPWTGLGLKPTSFLGVAQQMKLLQTAPPLVQANFWLSLQLTGFPLLFSSPPSPIKFVNDLYYFGYDGNHPSPETAFPLDEPSRAASFRREFQRFQSGEFAPVNTALAFYRAATHSSDTETQAGGWAMIAWLTGHHELYRKLKQPSLQGTTVFRTLYSHCETLRSFL